jgi:hypothetical protein
MRRASLSIFGVVALIACGGHGYEARTTTITGAPMTTSGPGVGEPELPRTLSSTSRRLALAVCTHEARCGRDEVASCIDGALPAVRSELLRWDCEPAATRARLEECLAGFDALTCERDLKTADRLCPVNAACGDFAGELVPPGRALADVWR